MYVCNIPQNCSYNCTGNKTIGNNKLKVIAFYTNPHITVSPLPFNNNYYNKLAGFVKYNGFSFFVISIRFLN